MDLPECRFDTSAVDHEDYSPLPISQHFRFASDCPGVINVHGYRKGLVTQLTIRIGKLLGIPITVDGSWFIIFALIVYMLAVLYFPQVNPEFTTTMNWVAGMIAALLLFASVLLHELMHSWVALRNGIAIGGITLFIFGGVSRMKDEPKTPEAELKMAIAGPATSFALAVFFWAIAFFGGRPLLGMVGFEVLGYLALINLVLAIFNMLPGFPLDGGRVLRAVLWGSFNSLDKATRYAAKIGQGIAWMMIIGGFWFMLFGGLLGGLWLVFIGWFLNNAAQQSYQQLVLRRALSGVEVSRVMTTDFPHVDPNLTIEEFVHDYLLRYDYAAFPVTEDETFMGIVTATEIRDIPRERWQHMRIRDAVRSPEEERMIDEEDDAFDALMHMAEGNYRRLLVMHEGRLKGMVMQDSIVNIVRTKLQLDV